MSTDDMSPPLGWESLPQAAVDAAFPILHGGQEFREEPSLRATLEVPVREALTAAGLAEVTADRDRLRSALGTVLGEFHQALHNDDMGYAPYYEATLDFAEMDAARAALAGGGSGG